MYSGITFYNRIYCQYSVLLTVYAVISTELMPKVCRYQDLSTWDIILLTTPKHDYLSTVYLLVSQLNLLRLSV